jgi:two-component system cell cycle response regulator
MDGSQALGLGLGAASFAAGAAALVADAPAVGLAAGALGLAAGWMAGADARARVRAASAALAEAEALAAHHEAVIAAADGRIAELEASIAAADAHADLAAAEAEAMLDPLTGLYGESFFGVTLVSRVAAARRHLRPVAVVLVEVAAGVKANRSEVADPGLVSGHVRATLREADTACYLEGGRFGLVLEDTPENGAVWTVERVRRALAVERNDLTLWAGVACYPAHAFDADELLSRATAALEAAKEWRQDRIEVATTSDV